MMERAGTILDLADRWMQAWIAEDHATLEAVLAPDYALIVSAVPELRIDRTAWLDMCERYEGRSFEYTHVQVRELAPGVMVMSSVAEVDAAIDGTDRSGPFWIVDVWRQGGRFGWQVCARYTGTPEAPRPSVTAISQQDDTA